MFTGVFVGSIFCKLRSDAEHVAFPTKSFAFITAFQHFGSEVSGNIEGCLQLEVFWLHV